MTNSTSSSTPSTDPIADSTQPHSQWLARFLPLIPHGGVVLDLACGNGRNIPLLVAAGHPMLGVDRDADLLAEAGAKGAVTYCLDLEAENFVWPFKAHRLSGIVMCNYLHRPLFPEMLAALAPEGVLIIETFGQGNEQFGKPDNPLFLLEPGELLGLLDLADRHGLYVVAYENGYVDTPKPAIVQRICLKKSTKTLAHL